MMFRSRLPVLLAVLLPVLSAHGAPATLSLVFQPQFDIPAGTSAALYGLGGAGSAGVEYAFAGVLHPWLSAGIDYTFAPLRANASVSIITVRAGGGAGAWVLPRLALRAGAEVGYWLGLMNGAGTTSGLVSVRPSVGARFLLSPALDVGVGAAYRYDLGIYQGVEVSASVSIVLGSTTERARIIASAAAARGSSGEAKTPPRGRGVELSNLSLDEVFPVFHKYYDTTAFGAVTLENREKGPVSDVRLTFFVKQFMDSAKDCGAPPDLAPGQKVDVPITALFSDHVLDVTEPTKVAADITLEFRMDGQLYRLVRTQSLRLLDRNAMTWADDRRPAAFVTSKDTTLLAISKGIAGAVRERGPEIMGTALLSGMGLFEAMGVVGVSYVSDPQVTFAERSQNKDLVDSLQFPRETLSYRAGDCDDLSILYAALLESVGIETAFITIPGHIFVAFNSEVPAAAAADSFATPADLVLHGGSAWVPVEITERRGGFLKAWSEGAAEWREASAEGSAGFIPVREAWRTYEPVQLPGTSEVPAPPQEAVVAALDAQVRAFVDREISPRVAAAQSEIRVSGETAARRNRLGVLYARYGRLKEAEAEFAKATAGRPYLPALLNLGRCQARSGDWSAAAASYDRAAAVDAKDPRLLAARFELFTATHQAEEARKAYAALAAVDSALAARYSSPGAATDGSRAGSVAAASSPVPWAE